LSYSPKSKEDIIANYIIIGF